MMADRVLRTLSVPLQRPLEGRGQAMEEQEQKWEARVGQKWRRTLMKRKQRIVEWWGVKSGRGGLR